MIKNYLAAVKQLIDLLPDEEEDKVGDKLKKFIEEKQ